MSRQNSLIEKWSWRDCQGCLTILRRAPSLILKSCRPLVDLYLCLLVFCRPSDSVVLTGPPDAGKTAVLQQVVATRRSQTKATLYINCREKDYMSSQAFAAELKLQLIAQFRSKTFRRFAFTLLDSLSEFRSFVIRLGPTQSPVGVENGSAFIQFLQHLQNPSVTALDDVLKDFVGFLRACKLCPMHIPPCLSQQ